MVGLAWGKWCRYRRMEAAAGPVGHHRKVLRGDEVPPEP
jgi:hypothetical protein